MSLAFPYSPCLLDRRHLTDARICGGCRRNLQLRIGDLAALYRELDEALVPSMGAKDGDRVSGTRHPQPPCRTDVLCLLGPAAEEAVMVNDDGDQTGLTIVGALLDWEADWRAMRGLQPAVRSGVESAIARAVRYLLANLNWACEVHPAIEAFAQDMRTVEAACRSALGDVEDQPKRGLRCPQWDGERPCAGLLSTDRHGVSCSRCGATWLWLDTYEQAGSFLAGAA
ncbi:hypothetical protein [Streptomyces sp. NPDC093261]|uniref:hypothetical protein n=1 Tax=Streptomyces sp. NPDC093261 TaxID=3366037 RepID=UPI003825C4D9